MKGIILAGGTGSRLYPLTRVTNKHLLPIYNKPMIYYPLYSMKEAGINEVLIISGPESAGDFLNLLGSGAQMGMKLMYEVQEEPGGIAQALGLAETFAAGEKVVVVLGDNVIEQSIADAVRDFEARESGGSIFLKKVHNPESYGVAAIKDGKVVGIVEKPENPKSDLAVIGCYMYDSQVFDVIKTLKPSGRGELEITDVNNFYLDQGTLTYSELEGFWGDCGESFDSMMIASKLVQTSQLADIDNTLTLLNREHRSLTSNVAVAEILESVQSR